MIISIVIIMGMMMIVVAMMGMMMIVEVKIVVVRIVVVRIVMMMRIVSLLANSSCTCIPDIFQIHHCKSICLAKHMK